MPFRLAGIDIWVCDPTGIIAFDRDGGLPLAYNSTADSDGACSRHCLLGTNPLRHSSILRFRLRWRKLQSCFFGVFVSCDNINGEMQTSGFQGYGRGIRKVGPKFSQGLGVDRASEMGVRSCGRGVRLLQPPRPRMSPGDCSTTSTYVDNEVSTAYWLTACVSCWYLFFVCLLQHICETYYVLLAINGTF